MAYAGIYVPESFKRELKYGLTCLTTTDEGLLNYLANVEQQTNRWLQSGQIQSLVVVVKGVETMRTLERWQFNVTIDKNKSNARTANNVAVKTQSQSTTAPKQQQQQNGKSLKDIHKEIQAIIRQITASVTFLPLLQESCTFDVLVYADKDIVVPQRWADADPCYLPSQFSAVQLWSFTTSVHKIDSMVAYKQDEDWE